MNSIVRIYRNDTVVDFERFTQKTVRGVLNQYRKAVEVWSEWMWNVYEDADEIRVYNVHGVCMANYTSAEFFAELNGKEC